MLCRFMLWGCGEYRKTDGIVGSFSLATPDNETDEMRRYCYDRDGMYNMHVSRLSAQMENTSVGNIVEGKREGLDVM